jgi:hypothetical protein
MATPRAAAAMLLFAATLIVGTSSARVYVARLHRRVGAQTFFHPQRDATPFFV